MEQLCSLIVYLIYGRKNKSLTERVYRELKNKTEKIFELISTVFVVVVGAFLLEFLVRRLSEGKKIKIKRRKNGCYINSANGCMKFFPLPPPSLSTQKRNLIIFQFSALFCAWPADSYGTHTHIKNYYLLLLSSRGVPFTGLRR